MEAKEYIEIFNEAVKAPLFVAFMYYLHRQTKMYSEHTSRTHEALLSHLENIAKLLKKNNE